MEQEERVREYVIKNYPKFNKEKKTKRDSKGKLVPTKEVELPIMVDIKGTHIEVKTHKDRSPMILSNTILG
ncbi:MAG: hypothetical protein ACR2M7_02570 [Bdellovibrionales bacterium]